MSAISIDYYKTSMGELVLGSFNNQLCICDWRYRKMRSEIDFRITTGLSATSTYAETPVIAMAKEQIEQYLNGHREQFDVPLLMVGTPFQKEVWNALLQIPYGKTESYLGLSNRLNNPKAIRAVASANGANALAIFVPCHRIIGSNGDLVGYAGGLDIKRKLLALESKSTNCQLDLFGSI